MTLTCGHDVEETAGDTRRLARIDMSREVRLFEPFTGEFLPAVTCNASSEGVCLLVTVSNDLRPGRFVTLHGLPVIGPRLSGTGDRATTARVVWAKPDALDASITRIGLQLYSPAAAVAA
ncbi:MAG: PilZ domain-containing protein [Tepidisphaeraceae bacterium]